MLQFLMTIALVLGLGLFDFWKDKKDAALEKQKVAVLKQMHKGG